ncbi:cell division protein ZipA C-terminal FtsZ-binding domain-containing protein [Candidatus Thalassolituus haligoni]|uniref:cell division protein ZipA C-terminal FtsZ-binding domain-containing protein n=1 Tax=Candidatus Thalassolituus haligoni TaxID=3100113 RepID=UPI00351509E4
MELTWKTVMILLGLLAVVIIVVDGIRRMKRARAMALKLDISKDFKFPEGNHNPELPGGRFRVVGNPAAAEADADARVSAPDTDTRLDGFANTADGVPDLISEDDRSALNEQRHAAENPLMESGAGDESISESISDGDELAAPRREAFHALEPDGLESDEQALQQNLHSWLNSRSRELEETPADQAPAAIIPKARPVNLDEAVPLLMTVEALGERNVIIEPELHVEVQDTADEQPLTAEDDEADPLLADADYQESGQAGEQETVHLEDEIAQQEEQGADQGSELIIYAGDDAEQLSTRAAAEVVLVIHARAREDAGFSGRSLLHLFDGCDLRYGQEQIFHRFEDADGKGPIQFSVAQTYEPGVFSPASMEDEHFSGLTFFLSLPGAKRPLEAYQAMSEMARLLADHLNAELKDATHSTFTKQTVEHDRQQILEYERRQALLAKKQAAGKRR